MTQIPQEHNRARLMELTGEQINELATTATNDALACQGRLILGAPAADADNLRRQFNADCDLLAMLYEEMTRRGMPAPVWMQQTAEKFEAEKMRPHVRAKKPKSWR